MDVPWTPDSWDALIARVQARLLPAEGSREAILQQFIDISVELGVSPEEAPHRVMDVLGNMSDEELRSLWEAWKEEKEL